MTNQSQYDATTSIKAEEHGGAFHDGETPTYSFTAGRNSAKESLLVAVRALNSSQAHAFYCPFIETKELNPSEIDCDACNALREIRQAGNYPIPEGEE
jgi:hypothetical protein